MTRGAVWASIAAIVACSPAAAPDEREAPSATSPPAVTAQPSSSAGAGAPAKKPGPIAIRYADKAKQIIAYSTGHRAAYDRLAYLTDRIGNRLSGTKALDRAIDWAKTELEKAGHEGVHTEKVMVPHWERGKEAASIVLPQARPLHILGLGGTVATAKGGLTAEVVVVKTFEALTALGEAGVKDKIVLFNAPMPAFTEEKGSGYGEVVGYRSSGPSKAAKLGAKAVLVRSLTAHSLQLPHTGALNYDKDVAKIPAAAVTTEDADYLARLAAAGDKVTVKLELSGKDLPDAPSANVVADLKGSELPDEVVVIGAHIDSWDVGQGAHDDGAGCMIVMQALTDLREMKLRPRRTIRVVLFTNEENGLKGARGFGEAHKDEMGHFVAGFEADIGGYAPRGFHVEAPKEKKDAVLARVNDLSALLAGLGVSRIEEGFSGADLIPLTKSGVVGIGLVTDHRHYFDIHHTEADTLDKVDPDELAKSVAATAVLAYVLADMPDRIDAP